MSERSFDRTPVRLVARVLAYDGLSMIPIGLIWVGIMRVAHPAVFVGVMLARTILVYALLWRELAPLRLWRARGAALEDHALLEVDVGLQRGPSRFARRYAVAFIGSLVLATALGQLGELTRVSLGQADLLTAGLMVVAATFGCAPMLEGLLDPVLLDDRASVGAELATRGLDARRRSTSLVGSITLLNVPYVLAVFYGATALGGTLAIDGWRSTSLAEEQLRAERGAREVGLLGELEGEPDPSSLRLVEASELPTILAEGRRSGPSVAAVDESRGMSVAAAPVGDGRWVVAEGETGDHLGLILLFAVAAPAFFAIPLAVANLSVSRSISRQLGEVRVATRRVLEAGQIRGVPRFRPPRNDEVGKLVRDFNGLIDVLQELAGAAHSVARGDLTVRLERPGDLHDAFRGMLARLEQSVSQIRSTALELASAAAEIQAVTQEQQQVVEAQSRGMDEAAATVGTLAEAARNIADTAADVLDNAEQTLSNTDATAVKIGELEAEAGSVGELLEVIREVADRSDLLALNGSLEATRAGESGRGFALVAAEMRRLAERVAGSVEDVRERIEAIGTAGASTVRATEASRKLAQQTTAAIRRISDVTAAQSRDTERVLDTVRSVGDRVTAAAAATAQTRSSAEGLRLHAGELERLTEQFVLAENPK